MIHLCLSLGSLTVGEMSSGAGVYKTHCFLSVPCPCRICLISWLLESLIDGLKSSRTDAPHVHCFGKGGSAKSSARSHEAKGNLSWIEEEGRGRRKEECALCQKAQGKVVLLATWQLVCESEWWYIMFLMSFLPKVSQELTFQCNHCISHLWESSSNMNLSALVTPNYRAVYMVFTPIFPL